MSAAVNASVNVSVIAAMPAKARPAAVLSSVGRPDEARVHLLRARPIAERLGHPQLLAWDHAGVSLVDAASGHFRRAAAGLVEALVHADRTGDPNT